MAEWATLYNESQIDTIQGLQELISQSCQSCDKGILKTLFMADSYTLQDKNFILNLNFVIFH